MFYKSYVLILGMFHEHSRPDRTDYVEIMWEELKQVEREDNILLLEKNYKICNNCIALGEYDFSSIMHYPSIRGSKNRTVIKPRPDVCLDEEFCQMGQRKGLSMGDVEKIQEMYDCGAF